MRQKGKPGAGFLRVRFCESLDCVTSSKYLYHAGRECSADRFLQAPRRLPLLQRVQWRTELAPESGLSPVVVPADGRACASRHSARRRRTRQKPEHTADKVSLGPLASNRLSYPRSEGFFFSIGSCSEAGANGGRVGRQSGAVSGHVKDAHFTSYCPAQAPSKAASRGSHSHGAT